MKYKIEYEILGDAKVHRRYYNALDSSTAKEMFTATQEESLCGLTVVKKSIKIYKRLSTGKWEEQKKIQNQNQK